MSELKKNLEYYIANQDDLVRQFDGRVLLIYEQRVVGDYDSLTDGYFSAQNNGYETGSFSLIKCSPGEGGVSVNYRTVNRFSRRVHA